MANDIFLSVDLNNRPVDPDPRFVSLLSATVIGFGSDPDMTPN